MDRAVGVLAYYITQQAYKQHALAVYGHIFVTFAGTTIPVGGTNDWPAIIFKHPPANPKAAPTAAAQALAAIEKSLPVGWRKAESEAVRFEAFRELPEADRR